jgi:DNA-binding MarR family transcriptional regulator
MSTPPGERLRIGQLLGNLVRLFRVELAERGESLQGVAGIRPAHLQVFGTIKADGTRLTDLAAWSNMSLSSMAELVDDLERLGYVERRPDPADGRAKLVCLTDTGWQAIRQGRHVIESIESDWGSRLGEERFESLCQSLQALVDALDPHVSPTYVAPPAERPTPGPRHNE